MPTRAVIGAALVVTIVLCVVAFLGFADLAKALTLATVVVVILLSIRRGAKEVDEDVLRRGPPED